MANWGVSQLFSRTQTSNQNEKSHDRQDLTLRLGNALAATLGNSDNPAKELEQIMQPGLDLSLQTLDGLSLPTALEQRLFAQQFLILESERDITYLYPVNNSNQILLITRPVAKDNSGQALQLLFTLLFYACIATALLIWAQPLIKRLVTLRNTTRAFGEGDLQQRIEAGSSLYISDIEKEFNRMADRIETLIADNKLLSNAVSHDLKTPLARLRFGIDVLEEAENPQQRQKYLDKISRDLQEMEILVDTLLCYARLDQAKLELKKDSVDLVAFINELTATLDNTTLDNGTLDNSKPSIDWYPPGEPHFVEGDRRYLSLLINNLVANACQHARHSISIKLDQVGNTTKLLIEDDGPGIPLAQRQAVLKPFVRGEQARSTPGHGMGLAIVNRITHWHRWSLAIGDSKSLGGAQVEITIS